MLHLLGNGFRGRREGEREGERSETERERGGEELLNEGEAIQKMVDMDLQ